VKDLILGESLEALLDYRGKTPKKMGADFTQDGVPVASAILVANGTLDLSNPRFVSQETYKKWMSVITRRGDVLLTSEAPLGRVARVPSDAPLVLGQRLFGLRGRDGLLDNGFLYYALQTERVRADLLGRSTGTTVFGIRQSALRNVRIPAPSFSDQQAIVEVLGALDDKIASNGVLADTLSILASAQYEQAKQNTQRSAILSDLVTTQYGLTTSATALAGPKFLRVTDINKKPWIEWGTTPNCTVNESDYRKYRVTQGDILVARMADPGKAAFVDDDSNEAVFASYLVRLKARDPSNALFIYYFLRSAEYLRYADGAMQGSVQKNMNAKVIVATQIPLPSRSEIHRFDATVTPLRASMRAVQQESENLAATRDALIPALMSGKLRVRDAEKVLEGVL
jgi:type I restriction enzyme S subunit